MSRDIDEAPAWPTHPDGRNKTVVEMTQDERRAVFKAASDRRRLRAAKARGETTAEEAP
jgi:predicted Fe-S protein YdhL (DUF1289 family)